MTKATCIPRAAARLRRQALQLALVLLAWLAPAGWQQAHAACASNACVSAGPRLLSVDSAQSTLLNALLGSLLGTTVSLNAADWTSLSSGNINLLKFAQALQTQVTPTVSTPGQALGSSVTLTQLINAAITAAQADGQTATVAALNNTLTSLGPLTGTINLPELLSVALPDGSLAAAKLNTLDLITGAIQLYNTRNVLTTPSPVGVSGSLLNLGIATVGTVQLYAQVIEPPVFFCGPAGTTFHTAAIRIKLNISLLGVNLDVSSLLGTGGATGVSASLGNLQLYLEVARADGILTAVNALTSAATVQVTPGIAAVYLGTISDANFWNRSRAIVAADLTPAAIGTLNLTLPILGAKSVSIMGKASSQGTTLSTATLNFTGPYPQTLVASTPVGYVGTLLTNLLGTLSLSLQPSVTGVLDPVLAGLLQPVVALVLAPLLSTALDGILSPVLQGLGVRIGEAVVTVTSASRLCSLSGAVYADANHNSARDAAEAGCGTTLYAKLIPTTSSGSQAAQTAIVDATTGLYAFTGVAAGSYSLVIDNNTTLSDTTPFFPTGWIGTEAPTLTRAFTLNAETPNLNFGLYNGSSVSGTVFKDNGSGGGTANDGIQQSAESGLGAAALRLTNNAGSSTLDSAVSLSNGSFTLYIPSASTGSPVKLVETNLPGYVSVGGGVGSTGGSYARATDTLTFTPAAGINYTGTAFGDVPDNGLTNDGTQSILAGATALYPHVFTAGTAGQVSFAATGDPATTWNVLLYRDTNCNGVVDAGELPLSAAISVTADQQVCLLVKVAAPPNAGTGSQHTAALTASFTYSTVSLSSSQNRNDVTLVGPASDAGLKLTKTVDKTSAKTGDVLTYTIRLENQSSAALGNLKVNDSTPAYTVFQSAACGTLGSGITACSVTTQPGVGGTGAVAWQLTGTLAPGAAAIVTMSVTLQ